MKKLFIIGCALLLIATSARSAFTEFYCQSGGSNLNAGSTTSNTAAFTYASGSWVSATGVFTVASGNPVNDGVAVNDFASVYADGATVTTMVGRVTARDATTITVSTTAKSGSTTDGTNNRTLKIGGAWKGPNGADGFPLNTVTGAVTNSSAEPTRINYKNDATYSITAAIVTPSVSTSIYHQGYTSSPGDGGRAILDGGTSGASYTLLNVGTTRAWIVDWIFTHNGATGAADAVNLGNANQTWFRCVVHDVVGNGFRTGGNAGAAMIECEAYACNTNNNANSAGFSWVTNGGDAIRCYSHDNTTSNTQGFRVAGGSPSLIHCIAASNGKDGFYYAVGNSMSQIINCDAYNNGGSGLVLPNNGEDVWVANCNFIKNTLWGIDASSGSSIRTGFVFNCGFGSGSQANGSGTITLATGCNLVQSGNVTYASNVTPWVDPSNGDFRITLAAAKGTGRGAFTQTQSGKSGLIGYPDIGAAQHQDLGGLPLSRTLP